MPHLHYRTLSRSHRSATANLPAVPPLTEQAGSGQPATHSAAAASTALDTVAPYLLTLMLRNVASDGFPFVDPLVPGSQSLPGCIIASPSYAGNLERVDQDYIYNWTRDSALAAMEIRAAELPVVDGVDEMLTDYVAFARRCQRTAPRIDLACYTVAGEPRTWTDAEGFHIWSNQSDGPALQTMAVLRIFDRISPAAQATAREVIAANLDCILQLYRQPTKNLWEEIEGHSFFTRSVQLQCLDELTTNAIGVPVPDGVADARAWLRTALDQHWNGQLYVSVLQDPPDQACTPARSGYDPNIDIVLAALYGAVPVTDPRMLATAAAAHSRWTDPDSDRHYEINLADQARGIGPLLGRYPDDKYDGDLADDGPDPVLGGHPWPVSTAAFAELYYRLAAAINGTPAVLGEELAAPFFGQVGITAGAEPADAAEQLRAAGDRMLTAILFHSDHYQLSEQFDGTTGFEKSVANLTWSYSSFLSAERARRAAGR